MKIEHQDTDTIPCGHSDETPQASDSLGGGCTHCGLNDGYLNLHSDHWYVCHIHKTKWCIGANLFSSWRHESPTEWEENFILIKDYTTINPLMPEETPNPREHLPRAVIDALEQILNCYFEDEKRHYKDCDGAQQTGHIFESLATIEGWLNGTHQPLRLYRRWMKLPE